MVAPVITQEIRTHASKLDEVSDEIDAVNVLKGKETAWDADSVFDAEKDKTAFRQYDAACDRVKAFYAVSGICLVDELKGNADIQEQHRKQTLAYNIRIREHHTSRPKLRMTVWAALELLDQLIDDSDPDTSVGQIEHLLQTAEAIRQDGKPDWMQLVGLVHDLGKLLVFLGSEGQWDVVGDTFVVGCAFPPEIIYHDSFKANPDSEDATLSTPNGIYEAGCGLDNVLLSWGHDEYIYDVMRRQSTIPKEGLSMLRYHSFYPWHREGAYRHLMGPGDEEQLKAVRAFNAYDLYSKSDEPPNKERLKGYYQELIDKYCPGELEW